MVPAAVRRRPFVIAVDRQHASDPSCTLWQSAPCIIPTRHDRCSYPAEHTWTLISVQLHELRRQ